LQGGCAGGGLFGAGDAVGQALLLLDLIGDLAERDRDGRVPSWTVSGHSSR
jgi:hypothetical protein